jgi:hypothetical protein
VSRTDQEQKVDSSARVWFCIRENAHIWMVRRNQALDTGLHGNSSRCQADHKRSPFYPQFMLSIFLLFSLRDCCVRARAISSLRGEYTPQTGSHSQGHLPTVLTKEWWYPQCPLNPTRSKCLALQYCINYQCLLPRELYPFGSTGTYDNK